MNLTVSGKSDRMRLTSTQIKPEHSVVIELRCNGGGELELILPKNMIDGVHTVVANSEIASQSIDFEEISKDAVSTIRAMIPVEADSIEIEGQP